MIKLDLILNSWTGARNSLMIQLDPRHSLVHSGHLQLLSVALVRDGRKHLGRPCRSCKESIVFLSNYLFRNKELIVLLHSSVPRFPHTGPEIEKTPSLRERHKPYWCKLSHKTIAVSCRAEEFNWKLTRFGVWDDDDIIFSEFHVLEGDHFLRWGHSAGPDEASPLLREGNRVEISAAGRIIIIIIFIRCNYKIRGS